MTKDIPTTARRYRATMARSRGGSRSIIAPPSPVRVALVPRARAVVVPEIVTENEIGLQRKQHVEPPRVRLDPFLPRNALVHEAQVRSAAAVFGEEEARGPAEVLDREEALGLAPQDAAPMGRSVRELEVDR